MLSRIKDLFIGPALPTHTLGHKQLNKISRPGGLLPGCAGFDCLCQPGDLPWTDHSRQYGSGLCSADRAGDYGRIW